MCPWLSWENREEVKRRWRGGEEASSLSRPGTELREESGERRGWRWGSGGEWGSEGEDWTSTPKTLQIGATSPLWHKYRSTNICQAVAPFNGPHPPLCEPWAQATEKFTNEMKWNEIKEMNVFTLSLLIIQTENIWTTISELKRLTNKSNQSMLGFFHEGNQTNY